MMQGSWRRYLRQLPQRDEYDTTQECKRGREEMQILYATCLDRMLALDDA